MDGPSGKAEQKWRDVVSRVGRSPAPAPPPPAGAVRIGRDDHRPFEGNSTIPPIERLARYAQDGDGYQFADVEADSLADYPRVYVFVHGWVPGSKETADLMLAEDGKVVRAWDEHVANRSGITMVDAYAPLLQSLAQADPEAAVLWFSWVDQSGTDTEVFAARDSLRNTEVNGRRLAIGLAEAVGDGDPQVQLIGHSHGCVVATHAALALRNKPEQLTLLDCPEDWFSRAGGAAGLLEHLLPRLQPDRGVGSTFVDAYASMFGRAYHDEAGTGEVVDVRLTPSLRAEGDVTAASAAHQFAVQWYAQTAADPAEYRSGYAWSVLRGFDPRDLAAGYLTAGRGHLLEVARRREDRSGDTVSQLVEPLPVGALDLSRSEPDVLLNARAPQDAYLLEFDYTLRRPGRKTRLEVAVDRRLLASINPKQPLPGRGRYLRLPATDNQDVQVQFRLTEPGLLTSADITGLRYVRSADVLRNFDDAGALALSAGLGALAGSAATLLLVGTWAGVSAMVRHRRGR